MPLYNFLFVGTAVAAFIAFAGAFVSLGFNWYYAAKTERQKFIERLPAFSAPSPIVHTTIDRASHLIVNTSIIFKWTNSGSTPALAASAWVHHKFVKETDTPPLFAKINAPSDVHSDIAPGQSIESPAITLSANDLKAMWRSTDKYKAYAWGLVEYRDASQTKTDPPHKSEYSVELELVVDPNLPINPGLGQPIVLRVRVYR